MQRLKRRAAYEGYAMGMRWKGAPMAPSSSITMRGETLYGEDRTVTLQLTSGLLLLCMRSAPADELPTSSWHPSALARLLHMPPSRDIHTAVPEHAVRKALRRPAYTLHSHRSPSSYSSTTSDNPGGWPPFGRWASKPSTIAIASRITAIRRLLHLTNPDLKLPAS